LLQPLSASNNTTSIRGRNNSKRNTAKTSISRIKRGR
jgi:hypothetical protein